MANKDKDEPKQAEQAQSVEDKINAAVERALEKAIPMAMMGVAQVLKPKEAPAAELKVVPGTGSRCTKCLQFINVCKDKHVMLKVHPESPRRFKRFPGITVNGITYYSPRHGAPIYVPAENNILQAVQAWEEEENNLREGKQIDHNAGNVSPVEKNNTMKQANTFGFREELEGVPQ